MGNQRTRFEQVPLTELQTLIARGEIWDEPRESHDDPELHSDGEPDFEYPQWQKQLHEALLELDKERLKERVALAESVISERLRSIALHDNHRAERQALADALTSLRILKKDRF